jgi:Bacterial surface proteins containing Ig-like domains
MIFCGTVLFFSCDDDDTSTRPVIAVSINGSTEDMVLVVGQTGTMTVTITPEDATDKSVTWSSDDTAIATVDENGVITAVAAGTTTITVKTNDGDKTASRKVVVSDISYVITLTDDSNGTAEAMVENASATEAVAGTEVTIIATANDGYEFKRWIVVSGNATLASENDATTTFIMPEESVEIMVEFVKKEGVRINDIVWAERNVNEFGTFVENIEDYGLFYQWDRAKAWPITEPAENWVYEPMGEGENWQSENDPCPQGWRIPTYAEFQDLLFDENVDREWIEQNGVNGYRFMDKTTGAFIFLPAAGYRHFGTGMPLTQGEGGYYWSETAVSAVDAWFMSFNSNYSGQYDNNRNYGYTIRCVCELDQE